MEQKQKSAQSSPELPISLPKRRPSRANTRSLSASVKPELVIQLNALAAIEDTSVAALIEEAAITLLRSRNIDFPDYLRHYTEEK